MNSAKSYSFQILKRKETLLFFVTFVAGLSMLGWIFDNIPATSFSLNYIPIAPSTALIFAVLSIISVSNLLSKKSRLAHFGATAFITLIVLFCLNIFLDYIFDFSWDIENIFLKNPHVLGFVPIGRMSPITAWLLIFISISILSIRNESIVIKYIGGSLSLLVLLIVSVLIIGYLFKAPLLYGSAIIPVALPTAICFLLFSIFLLRVFELKYWTFNLIDYNVFTLRLLRSFLPIVISAVIVQGILITNFTFIVKSPTLSVALVLFIVVVFVIFIVVKVSGNFGDKLHRAEQTLKESEMEFRSLAESMPQIVWTTRADGWNTFFNQQWVDYTGLTLEESYGHGWNSPFHPDDKQGAWDAWQYAVNHHAEYSIECRLRCHDGTYHWWLIRGVPQINAGGEIIKWFGTCTDIQKIKEAEITLKESEKQLLRLNEDKDRFISILGHDLKAPHNNIIGLSDYLVEEIRSLSINEIEDIAEKISKSARITNKLLEDILLWVRMQQGSIPFNPQILSFSDISSSVLEILNPGAHAKQISISDSGSGSINIYADPYMLKTVLLNIISNAIKFTDIKGKIIINGEQNTDHVMISVSDNGVGISTENQSKLFDISEVLTTKGTAGEIGTGIGLFLCKEFIEKHGGQIWVVSEAGKGSEFKFTLPVL